MIAPPALDAYASQLAGKPVAVHCLRDQSFAPDLLGYVKGMQHTDGTIVYDDVIRLPASTCRRLVALLAGTPRPRIRDDEWEATLDGQALETLTHEATHLRLSSGDEALVECETTRNWWQAVKGLRLAAHRDRDLERAMRHAHHETLPDYQASC